MKRTKVVDERYSFAGYLGVPSHCRLRIFTRDGLPPVIIVSERDDNPGTSITNAADVLYPGIIARYLTGWLDQADALYIIEHYPKREGRGGETSETFAQVGFTSWRPVIEYRNHQKFAAFGKPTWSHISRERLLDLVDDL